MIRAALLTLLACAATSASVAKLPPPNDEAKAKAAETAARTKWTNDVANFQLCKAQDKLAARYRADAPKAGKAVAPAASVPACADPGAFAYTPAETRPLEAAGAHSPAKTATQPPNTTVQPAAQAPKK